MERCSVPQVLEDLGKQIGASDQSAPRPTVAPTVNTDKSLIPVEVHEPSGGPLQTISGLISPLLGPLATTGMIVIFVVFILVQREDLRDRMIRLVGSTDIAHTTAAIDDAAHRLSHLFLTQLAINTGFAILIGSGLWFIGIPSAFLWGVLAGILRFIPYIGSILGMVFPLALALSVDPGWSMIIETAVLFLTLEIITGQVIEPVVEGHSTGLSPLAVIVAATFWAWLWGPVGLVLATPLTVILVVLGRHVEALKFLDVLFGDEPALSESESFYQRMLARDPVEAVEQAKAFMGAHSLADYCDDVARPGLLLAQKDFERGQLLDGTKAALRGTIETLLSDIAHEHWLIAKEAHASTMANASKLPILRREQLAQDWQARRSVMVIGVNGDFDQAAAAILATLCEDAWRPGSGRDVRRPDRCQSRQSRPCRYVFDLPVGARHENTCPYSFCRAASAQPIAACQTAACRMVAGRSQGPRRSAASHPGRFHREFIPPGRFDHSGRGDVWVGHRRSRWCHEFAGARLEPFTRFCRAFWRHEPSYDRADQPPHPNVAPSAGRRGDWQRSKARAALSPSVGVHRSGSCRSSAGRRD